jgi:DNA-binding IclR family transcriptional regulator
MREVLSNTINKPPVPVVDRTVRIIEAIALAGSEVRSVQALARELGIAQATCYRIVRTLEQTGWLVTDASGAIRIGDALRSLSSGVDARTRLIRIIEPLLRDLAEKSGHSCKVTMRFGDEAITVVRVDSDLPYRMTSKVGARFNLCVGSSGAILVRDVSCAELERLIKAAPQSVWRHQKRADLMLRVKSAKERGYTLDRGGYHPDIHGLSVAIELGQGQLAALSLISTASGLPDERVPEIARNLKKMADAASCEFRKQLGV